MGDLPADVPIWREPLAAMEWLALRTSRIFYGRGVPRGDGAPVIAVPGFLGTDFYLGELSRWLRRIGYRVYRSQIGWNAGCVDVLVSRLLETIGQATQENGRRVHLIGHSLGGVLARAATARRPDLVASIVTLGSPLRGISAHPLILKVADAVRARLRREGRPPHCFEESCSCESVSALTRSELLPQLAVYTRTDGILDWRTCQSGDPAIDREVSGTHLGLVVNRAVYEVISAHLAG
jgi:pimeloyl-ACP methyl ester carboxylesterase